jgi:hypothetical protein
MAHLGRNSIKNIADWSTFLSPTEGFPRLQLLRRCPQFSDFRRRAAQTGTGTHRLFEYDTSGVSERE